MIKSIAAGLLVLSFAVPAQALSLSKSDRMFLGGAITGALLYGLTRKDDQVERIYWDDGYNHYPPPPPRNECRTSGWCLDRFHSNMERRACINGVNACMLEQERRYSEAYRYGRNR